MRTKISHAFLHAPRQRYGRIILFSLDGFAVFPLLSQEGLENAPLPWLPYAKGADTEGDGGIDGYTPLPAARCAAGRGVMRRAGGLCGVKIAAGRKYNARRGVAAAGGVRFRRSLGRCATGLGGAKGERRLRTQIAAEITISRFAARAHRAAVCA